MIFLDPQRLRSLRLAPGHHILNNINGLKTYVLTLYVYISETHTFLCVCFSRILAQTLCLDPTRRTQMWNLKYMALSDKLDVPLVGP